MGLGILGIDLDHRGLLCRADPQCRFIFVPVSMDNFEHLRDAGIRRDVHERVIHGYEHKILPGVTWGFGQKMTARGKTTLGRKRGTLVAT